MTSKKQLDGVGVLLCASLWIFHVREEMRAKSEKRRVPGKVKGVAALLGLATMGLFAGATLQGCEQVQKVANFVDSISDGAACTQDLACLGVACLTPEDGFPGGYCTTLGCQESGCSGLFSECFRTSLNGQDTNACFETCIYDGTCARANEGYQCQMLADTPVCIPPGFSGATVQGVIGSSCSNSAQCNGDDAVCLQTFFGGYCTQLNCTSDSDCVDSNPCVALNPEGATDEEKQFACMDSCSADSDCRFGYSCQEYEGSTICLESDGADATTRNPDGADDGEPCLSNINCKGGTCIREAENASGDVSYPEGYCTTRDCDSADDCNGDNTLCISRERSTACRVTCGSDSDCRTGYSCVENALGESYCDSTLDPPETPVPDSTNESIEVVCQASKTLNFELPEGSIGFFIAPFTKDNNKIVINSLKKPDGSTLNIQTDYSFLAINPEILGSYSPIMFPASDSDEFKDAFGAGSYSMEVTTRASEVCYYVVPQVAEGTKLAMNLYFVGVPGLTAQSASADSDIQAMLSLMRQIYGKEGIDVEVKNYIDASDQVSRSYGVIRDFYDVFNLVATSTSPGDARSEALTVNVFLIEDFNISDAPGLLGVSTGIPGMAAFHGSIGSGLVFSTASLGQDNQMLGQTLAHEVGHFLGLRHTTEHQGVSEDPITDTPSCPSPDDAYRCRDSTNFMFPFALGGDSQTVITDGQGFVLRRSPLVQP